MSTETNELSHKIESIIFKKKILAERIENLKSFIENYDDLNNLEINVPRSFVSMEISTNLVPKKLFQEKLSELECEKKRFDTILKNVNGILEEV